MSIKKLLKNSNEDSENMVDMLEDEKDELERELGKGHAVNASKKRQ